jgi:hypothetical protein
MKIEKGYQQPQERAFHNPFPFLFCLSRKEEIAFISNMHEEDAARILIYDKNHGSDSYIFRKVAVSEIGTRYIFVETRTKNFLHGTFRELSQSKLESKN